MAAIIWPVAPWRVAPFRVVSWCILALGENAGVTALRLLRWETYLELQNRCDCSSGGGSGRLFPARTAGCNYGVAAPARIQPHARSLEPVYRSGVPLLRGRSSARDCPGRFLRRRLLGPRART